jgi:Acyl-protein synthetase, LuxE
MKTIAAIKTIGMIMLNLIFIEVVMDFQNNYKNKIFSLQNQNFDMLALELYKFQTIENPIYQQYQKLMGIDYTKVTDIVHIPYLPIEFFKTHPVLCKNCTVDLAFESSGTTGMQRSKHYIHDQELYKHSLFKGFEYFFGKPEKYVFVFLLPVYLENKSSSLLYMAKELAASSKYQEASFYLNNFGKLFNDLQLLMQKGEKIFLWGLTSALTDFFTDYKIDLKDSIILETGGMKGRQTEFTRKEVHKIISDRSGVVNVYSEYGMTELLSQAYSLGDGLFKTVPWMKILIRDMNDPLNLLDQNETGCINIIDLANIYSCAFIATDDIGKTYPDQSFEVIGRMDNSVLRGCNLMTI